MIHPLRPCSIKVKIRKLTLFQRQTKMHQRQSKVHNLNVMSVGNRLVESSLPNFM